jgi:PAS domain S-box-containing protein
MKNGIDLSIIKIGSSPSIEEVNMKKSREKLSADDLRQKAEEIIRATNPVKSAFSSWMSEPEALKIVHELQVHQIELDLQNDELIESKQYLEDTLNEYQELYDFAPSGHFTLNLNGTITKLNLAGSQMLGKPRSHLVDTNFDTYISDNSRNDYLDFLEKVFETTTRISCDISLKPNGNESTFLHLTGIRVDSRDICLVSAVDITALKQAEQKTREAVEKMEATLEALPDLLMEIGEDGHCYNLHSHRPEIYSHISVEYIGKKIFEFLPPDVTKKVMAAIKEARERGISMGRKIELGVVQGLHCFEIIVTRLVYNPEAPLRFIMIWRDLTPAT